MELTAIVEVMLNDTLSLCKSKQKKRSENMTKSSMLTGSDFSTVLQRYTYLLDISGRRTNCQIVSNESG